MSGTVCASCGQDLLPRLEICFDCELASTSPPEPARPAQRYHCEPTGDRKALTDALKALFPDAAAEDVAWIAKQPYFDIVAELTSAQEQRLSELLRAHGTQVATTENVPPAARGVRLCFDGLVREKLGATCVIGGASLALGISIVPAAAAVMGVALLSRVPRLVERRLSMARPQADAYLAVMDEAVIAHARTARSSITSPAVLDILRHCLASCAEMSAKLRDGGAHLSNAGLKKIDAELTQLTRVVMKLAVAAHRMAPTADATSGEPYRTSVLAHETAMNQLRAVAKRIDALKASAAQARATDSAALATLLSRTTEAKSMCELPRT